MALSINGTVITIVSITIGIVLVGSLLAPVANDVMSDLTETDGSGNAIYENGASWASLVGVVVVIAVIGLIVVAVNGYTGGKAR